MGAGQSPGKGLRDDGWKISSLFVRNKEKHVSESGNTIKYDTTVAQKIYDIRRLLFDLCIQTVTTNVNTKVKK